MDLDKVLDLPSELLLLWHTHRTELLLSASVLFACLRLAIHWRQRRVKEILTPPPASPVEEKKVYNQDAGQELESAETKERSLLSLPLNNLTAPRPKTGPKRVSGVKRSRPTPQSSEVANSVQHIQPHIFYFSLGGSTKSHAENVLQSFSSSAKSTQLLHPILHDLTEIDYDDYFTTAPKSTSPNTTLFYIILLPTYDISTELDNFTSHLEETHHDFRVDTAPLSSLAGYAVFGFGDKQEWPSEDEGFCRQAVEVDKWMSRLTGGKRAFPVGLGDVRGDVEERLRGWLEGVTSVLGDLSAGKGLGEGVTGSGEAVESGDEAEDEDIQSTSITLKPTKRKPTVSSTAAADLEDLRAPPPVDFTTSPTKPKQMVPLTSPTHTNLTKQGYTIIGSHSGVKICRWTKSALRGRGSCYKYSFYGIASHLCMEATPSLSCSNKCVFCWRHGTNPVSTTWKWEVNPPEMVFAGMKEGHYRKIKSLRGVPGVRAERFEEAGRVRHCALSLVGEPIFYPRINELLALLHRERISTFLVCNAQHPDQLAALEKVTQLYVSIDASNAESLKRIDRPLHRDYWARFLKCMDILRERRYRQRTVFRLTLVKDFNVEDEIEGYADLVARALPGFVEVKGVTYCGTSTAAGAGLSMKNVPFYEEVTSFVLGLEAALKRRGLEYGIAAEHKHSCCVLLADKGRFFKKGEDGVERWYTRIGFEKFFDLLEGGKEFAPEDYIGEPTPEWALWGMGGFDPRDERVDRKGRKIEVVG